MSENKAEGTAESRSGPVRFTQIAASANHYGFILYALDDAGRVWEMDGNGWKLIPCPVTP